MKNITKKIPLAVKKDKRLLIIIFIGLLGMLLILFSEFFSGNHESEAVSDNSIAAAEERITKRVEELLKSVDGAGKVKVMVTLECLEERVVALNTQTKTGADSYDYSEEYVIVDTSGDEAGLTLKIITPVIRGVGITCEGGASSVVREEITKLVGSALGISSNKIWVTKMQE